MLLVIMFVVDNSGAFFVSAESLLPIHCPEDAAVLACQLVEHGAPSV
jgi:hypothetical protein